MQGTGSADRLNAVREVEEEMHPLFDRPEEWMNQSLPRAHPTKGNVHGDESECTQVNLSLGL